VFFSADHVSPRLYPVVAGAYSKIRSQEGLYGYVVDIQAYNLIHEPGLIFEKEVIARLIVDVLEHFPERHVLFMAADGALCISTRSYVDEEKE
jgi:hypothetical protein